jgi:hypothetical protein
VIGTMEIFSYPLFMGNYTNALVIYRRVMLCSVIISSRLLCTNIKIKVYKATILLVVYMCEIWCIVHWEEYSV